MLVDMRPVTVRSATVDDLPVLRDVYRRASLSNAGDRALLARHPELLELDGTAVRDGRTRVAVVEGRVAGFATLAMKGDTAELEDLFVDPDRMRAGVGRALIADMVVAARAAGRAAIEVDANPHARAFYDSVGFEALGEVDLEYGVGVRMRRGTG